MNAYSVINSPHNRLISKGEEKMSIEPKNHWKCSKCGYTLEAPSPPQTCPECKEPCEFKNITCYIPDCGGPGNIDPRL